MTRRVFYIAFGATVGILAVRRASAAAQQWQPENLAHRLTVAVSNETDHPIDMAALNRLIATAIDCYA